MDSCPCGRTRNLTWSPLWEEYLCSFCMFQRTCGLLDEHVTMLPARDDGPHTLASGGYISPGTTVLVSEP